MLAGCEEILQGCLLLGVSGHCRQATTRSPYPPVEETAGERMSPRREAAAALVCRWICRLLHNGLDTGAHHTGKPLLPSSAVVFVALSPTPPPPFAGAEREDPDGNVEMRPPLMGISRHCRRTRSAGRVTPSGPRTSKTGRHSRLASLLAAWHIWRDGPVRIPCASLVHMDNNVNVGTGAAGRS